MPLCSKFQCFTKPKTEIGPQVLLEATIKVECVITEGEERMMGSVSAQYNYTCEAG